MKRLISSILVISLLGGQIVKADNCPAPVSLLNQGQASPCYGYLFSPDKEKELESINDNYKLLQQVDTIKDKEIDLYKGQVADLQSAIKDAEAKSQLWQDKATNITQKYTQTQQSQIDRDLFLLGGGVAGGILLTVLAAWAVGKATGH